MDIALIAQAAAETVQPFAGYGIIGAFGTWLCVRVEKRMDRLEHTMRGLAAGVLMDLSTRKVLAPVAQKIVDDMLNKMGIAPNE